MQKNAKSSLKDVIVVGFAMFAIFFGAGNLIFPPYLGMVSGQEWFKGFLCFMIADAGLAVMTVLAMIRYDGTVWSMLRRLSKPAAAVMATVAMLCVGPLLCIPRTCATTFEMGVLPLFPECSPWLFGALFFGAVDEFNRRMAEMPAYDHVIFSLRGMPNIDVSGAQAVLELCESLQKQGKTVACCGMADGVRTYFDRTGITVLLGETAYFWNAEDAILDLLSAEIAE